MNPVNDLIVVDFCEWLKKEFVKNEKSILEIINAEDHFFLRKYAQKYLDEAKQGCKIRCLIRSFANSEELSEVISKCPRRQFYNERSHSCNRYNCLYYEIETAFMSFLEKSRIYLTKVIVCHV